MEFLKYHALGNDYLVLSPESCPQMPDTPGIQKICHRNFGLGSDGILYGPLPTPNADFGLRIYNPDGSEAEKSGNGLRIFARALFDQGLVHEAPFKVETPGGIVECVVRENGQRITVEMGKVSFDSEKIPVAGPKREMVEQIIEIDGTPHRFFAATIGNPHCVLPMDEISAELAQRLGPKIETHALFPNRTNVQFLKVLDRNNIQIEIWERGAGYTLASGSSSSAAAAVAYKMGAVGGDITVHMPGGLLQIHITEDFSVTMTGPTTAVGIFEMNDEVLSQKLP